MIGKRIEPKPIYKDIPVDTLIEEYFSAYNAARISETCKLLEKKILSSDETVLGLSLSGALTPAGLGQSAIVSWIENGWVDYIISTGANLYHDIHYGLKLPMHRSGVFHNDMQLKDKKMIRIYDILFDQDVLFKSDKKFMEILKNPEFQKELSTSELNFLLGKYINEIETQLGSKNSTILAAAYRNGLPIYTPSPGDSTIGLVIANMVMEGYKIKIDPIMDVNETAAIALYSKRNRKSAAMILGGGSPKNFLLQTFPLLDEIMKIDITGHDYFIQITDARPDTGGLSGATPSEALTWGKVDPDGIPDTTVAYVDTTIALPLICAYIANRVNKRPLKRLYDKRKQLLDNLMEESILTKKKGL